MMFLPILKQRTGNQSVKEEDDWMIGSHQLNIEGNQLLLHPSGKYFHG